MLPLQVQTAYAELLQRFRSAPQTSIDGSILRVEKAGRSYWVARRRIGNTISEQSIGPDSPEIQASVQVALQKQSVAADWNRDNARLVAMLRSAACLTPDQSTGKILLALDRIGFFRSGGILGGTHAFRHYPLHLGADVPQTAYAMTGDIDVLAPAHMVLAGDDGSLTARLSKAGLAMRTVFGLTEDDPQKWVIDGTVELEILGPVGRGGATSHRHKGVGERVQARRYLDYACKDPVQTVSLYRSGVLVTIPSPQRYALHKLLIAQLRKGDFALKKQKDLNQAAWLVAILAETQPYDLWEAWNDLSKRGVMWRKLAQASLNQRPEIGQRIIQIQDEFGPVAGSNPLRSNVNNP